MLSKANSSAEYNFGFALLYDDLFMDELKAEQISNLKYDDLFKNLETIEVSVNISDSTNLSLMLQSEAKDHANSINKDIKLEVFLLPLFILSCIIILIKYVYMYYCSRVVKVWCEKVDEIIQNDLSFELIWFSILMNLKDQFVSLYYFYYSDKNVILLILFIFLYWLLVIVLINETTCVLAFILNKRQQLRDSYFYRFEFFWIESLAVKSILAAIFVFTLKYIFSYLVVISPFIFKVPLISDIINIQALNDTFIFNYGTQILLVWYNSILFVKVFKNFITK